MTEPTPAEFLLYQSEDGQARVEVRMASDTVWLSLNQLSELFGRDKSVISRHVKNVFDEGELRREATVALYATVQPEGARTVQREIEHYNLDVSSPSATESRANGAPSSGSGPHSACANT